MLFPPRRAITYLLFQSTPSVSRGRCIRRPWRNDRPRRFNPRPPFPEGDAASPTERKNRETVSIHALRFQRAMRGVVRSAPAISKFQSTPSVSRGRCPWASSTASPLPCFNPRPPFPEGDAVSLQHAATVWCGFNPRPPFPEGDARYVPVMESGEFVSIHALRFQRAMP